jgi:hypothetical protein
MNIKELDSYNLVENAKIPTQLNPAVWDRHEHLVNRVKDLINVSLEEYCQYLGLNESQIKDVVIAGNNAGYTYNSKSNIDVVVQADLNTDPTFREFFNEHAYKFNRQHPVKIDNTYIKFYIHPTDETFENNGSYSILSESWVIVPKRKLIENSSVSKLKALEAAAQPKVATPNLKKKIVERKPFVYGYGQDRLDEVEITPDGTNPTTCQFTNEDEQLSDEEILKDFIDFCAKELKLEHMPAIKLRKDPQWPVVHKTFGRYIDDIKMLEVAWGHRHIMDVLRTVAHELTHKHQHERDGEHMGSAAGETGSPYENEANARAGILMRDYARLHPEYFAAGQAADLHEEEVDEGLKSKAAAAAIVAALSGNAAAQSVQGILGFLRNAGTVAQQAHNITRAGINAEVQQEINNYVRAQGGDANAQNLSHLYQLQSELKQQENNTPNYTQQAEPVNEATGYIPTAAEADDPRFEMALTVDVHPGAIGKAANAFLLNTDAQGHPQELRPDGIVKRMMNEYLEFKQK